MTITYSLEVASATSFAIHKLLLRWKGSIWKSTWLELTFWLVIYSILSFSYRFVMTSSQQRFFEDICHFFYMYGEYIPFTFMLGFYVNAVFTRWRDAFANLGWIDTPALLIATCVKGSDETARKIRRTIVRYMVLTQALVFRDISTTVNKRFPTMNHLAVSGMMMEDELKEWEKVVSPHWKYWLPFEWIYTLLRRARELNMIDNDINYSDLLREINQFRINIGALVLYDWIPIPLVYTQVANLAVRTYFLIALFGRQYLISDRDLPLAKTIDLYVPIMTIMQFLFYIGWLKVAEVLLNPFGEDDDDFESNYIIDRNLQVGLSIVDECCNTAPDLQKDAFWHDSLAEPLYTAESAARPQNPMTGSCAQMEIETSGLYQRKRIMSPNLVDEVSKKLSDAEAPSFIARQRNGSIGNESTHSTSSFRNFLPASLNNWMFRNSSAPNIFQLYEPRLYRSNLNISPKRTSFSSEQNDQSIPQRKNGYLPDDGVYIIEQGIKPDKDPENWLPCDGLSVIHEEEIPKTVSVSSIESQTNSIEQKSENEENIKPKDDNV